MEEKLEVLLEMQHIDQRLKELENPAEQKAMQKMGFKWDPAKKEKLTELWQKCADRLGPDLLEHYKGLKDRYGEAIVPIDGGICLGCFMQIPTSWMHDIRQSLGVKTCGHCGRILYWVD